MKPVSPIFEAGRLPGRRGGLSVRRLCAGACLAVALLTAIWASAAAQAAPALWRYGDEDTTVYLFGTIHLMRSGVPWRDAELDRILETVDHFVFEVSQDKMRDPATMARLVREKALLPAGQSLSALLPPDLKQRLFARAEAAGLPPAMLERMRPWYAGVQVTIAAARALGLDPEQGVDVALMSFASRRSVPVSGLETVEEQLDLFAGLARDDEIAFLEAALDDSVDLETLVNRLESAWLDGREQDLAALLNENLARDPDLVERLLTARNRRWVEPLAALLAQPGTHFVAVGAAHLAGPENLIMLLKARQIAVVRLR